MRRGFKIMALIGALLGVVALSGTAGAGPDRPVANTTDVGIQANYNGVCEAHEVCLYYNSNCQGSFADFQVDIPDFAPYRFLSSGAGRGQGVKNNAASARNKDTNWIADIHFNSNYGGVRDRIPKASGCRNLVNTYNENASLKWRTS